MTEAGQQAQLPQDLISGCVKKTNEDRNRRREEKMRQLTTIVTTTPEQATDFQNELTSLRTLSEVITIVEKFSRYTICDKWMKMENTIQLVGNSALAPRVKLQNMSPYDLAADKMFEKLHLYCRASLRWAARNLSTKNKEFTDRILAEIGKGKNVNFNTIIRLGQEVAQQGVKQPRAHINKAPVVEAM